MRKTAACRSVYILLWVCLAVLSVSGSCGAAQGKLSNKETRWEPRKTRVFLVSLTRFKGGDVAPWGSKDRLDGEMVRVFKSRGVPESQIVFLSDEQANSQNIKKKFDEFLNQSAKGELLIFYFSSHGRYNAKTGAFAYSTYDGHLPFEWAFDSIERSFNGSHVLMLADCCYSGGIVEMAPKRSSAIAYACLSSTYSHNVGYSGWRFFDCMLRALEGSPVVDLNGNGHIDLEELARFSEKHMAFVAEGKPMFVTTNGFNPRLILAEVTGKKKQPEIGRYVEAWFKGKWNKAEITDVKAGQIKVHHTAKGSTYNNWVSADQIRPFIYWNFQKGSRVEAEGSSFDKWRSATVMESSEHMHLVRFEGYSPAYDEWVGPSKIRSAGKAGADGIASNLSGKWTGHWSNTSNEKGEDSLVLAEDTKGNLNGTWSSDVKVSGKRINAGTAHLWGQTDNRAYRFTATVQQGVIKMKYTAQRLDEGGSYGGVSTLTPAR
jgi:hypothetical protein